MKNKYAWLLPVLLICLLSQFCSRKPIYRVNLKTCVCTSAPDYTCDWMGELLRSHPQQDIALTDICLPALFACTTFKYNKSNRNRLNLKTATANLQSLMAYHVFLHLK